jgi:hypothetical protein
MVSAELSRRVGKVVGLPAALRSGDAERREFQDALLDATGSKTWLVSGSPQFLPEAEPAKGARWLTETETTVVGRRPPGVLVPLIVGLLSDHGGSRSAGAGNPQAESGKALLRRWAVAGRLKR